jgi:hypothetical protein
MLGNNDGSREHDPCPKMVGNVVPILGIATYMLAWSFAFLEISLEHKI